MTSGDEIAGFLEGIIHASNCFLERGVKKNIVASVLKSYGIGEDIAREVGVKEEEIDRLRDAGVWELTGNREGEDYNDNPIVLDMLKAYKTKGVRFVKVVREDGKVFYADLSEQDFENETISVQDSLRGKTKQMDVWDVQEVRALNTYMEE